MTAERKAAWILLGIAIFEGSFVIFSFAVNGRRFLPYLGYAPHRAGTIPAWILASIVVAVFVGASVRLPSVRSNLFRPSGLKVLALMVAVSAGILEELVFRRLVMDGVARHGGGVAAQILASGLLFGLGHGVWGLMGKSIRAAGGATVATGLLGAALAGVYVIGGRSLAPCIAAHFAINALIEPGLVLAATRGEMGSA
jgi:hypothetical protein